MCPAATTSGWEIASAIGTMGATVVALWLGLYQWRKDRSRQRDVRAALSKALQTDLATWRQVVEQCRSDFDQKKLTHEQHFVDWVRGLSKPTMPTHERFARILPDLGRPTSTKVVHAYAECLRVAELVSREAERVRGISRDNVQIAADIRPYLDALSNDLSDAITALDPYVTGRKR
ncbi:hypothetical protein [Dyella sp. A6]|uniref:hypothetical protein n=1 Tax=Dyella aluminiiresistens TaxID=3069105 RepID=UPI002E77B133|nr:hypothetical protein [Dyella sp. A6]